ncbi:YggT family protein, partial [Salmonella sp. ZJHZ20_0162]
SRADFYNPFSQFIVKATQPVVAPLRRVIPSIGSLDLATVVFAYVLCVLKFVALNLIISGGAAVFDISFLIFGALSLLKAAGGLIF